MRRASTGFRRRARNAGDQGGRNSQDSEREQCARGGGRIVRSDSKVRIHLRLAGGEAEREPGREADRESQGNLLGF